MHGCRRIVARLPTNSPGLGSTTAFPGFGWGLAVRLWGLMVNNRHFNHRVVHNLLPTTVEMHMQTEPRISDAWITQLYIEARGTHVCCHARRPLLKNTETRNTGCGYCKKRVQLVYEWVRPYLTLCRALKLAPTSWCEHCSA